MIKESDRENLTEHAIASLNRMISDLQSSDYRLIEFNVEWATIDDPKTRTTFLSFRRLNIAIEPMAEVA